MKKMFLNDVKTTVCMGLVLACVFAPYPAGAQSAAQSNVLLNSAQPWKLQMVSAEEGQGVPFCAIHKEYESQYELFLSMNPLGAMKILVRLMPGQYISGKAYNVILSLDNGYKKEFSKKEVYQDSIDLGLGKDPGFSESLAQAKTLSLQIEDRTIQFNVPDMGAATKDLEYCISGGEMTNDAAAMGLYDKPNKAKLENPKDTKAQIDKTQTLLMGEERAPSSPKGSQLSIDERDLLESLKKKMVVLEREKESLRAQLTDYRQEELTGLKEKMVTNQSVNDYENKTRILEEKIKELEQLKSPTSCAAPIPAKVEQSSLGNGSDAQKAVALEAEVSSLRNQVSALQQEKIDLQAQQANKSGAVANSSGQLKSMETEIAALKEESAKLQQSNQNLSAQLAEAQNSTSVTAEAQSMKGDLASLRSDNERLRQANVDLEDKLSRAQTANPGAVPEDMQYQLNYLQKQNQALEKQLLSCQ